MLAELAAMRGASAQAQADHAGVASSLSDIQMKLKEAEAATAGAQGRADDLQQQLHSHQSRCAAVGCATNAEYHGQAIA